MFLKKRYNLHIKLKVNLRGREEHIAALHYPEFCNAFWSKLLWDAPEMDAVFTGLY